MVRERGRVVHGGIGGRDDKVTDLWNQIKTLTTWFDQFMAWAIEVV